MNIEEFRTKFPQYNDMPDADLAKSLHDKMYPNMDMKEFNSSFLGSKQDSPKDKGILSGAKRIVDIYKQEVSEGGQAFNKMVEKPSGKTILPGLAGGLRWGMASLTALSKGAIKEPISGGLQDIGVPKPAAEFVGESADIGLTGFVPYGKLVKGAIGAIETKEAMEAGKLIAADAAKVQAGKEAREMVNKPALK